MRSGSPIVDMIVKDADAAQIDVGRNQSNIKTHSQLKRGCYVACFLEESVRLFLLLAMAVGLTTPLFAADPGAGKVAVELNKLETNGDGCQPYLVFANKTDIDFDSLKLDLVMFDDDGIIARRVAVEGAPLSSGKMVVKAFDIPNLACDRIGRVLLNGLTKCADLAGDRSGCLALIETGSRAADVAFIQ